MKFAAAVLLAAALAACGKKTPAPPGNPSPEAVGAELATFHQLLVPVLPDSAKEYLRDPSASLDYSRGISVIEGSTVTVFAAYAGIWLTPEETLARPMTPLQFLRAFESAHDCAGAVVIAPRGRLYVPREQLIDVIIAVQKTGASDANLPPVLLRGSRR